MRVRECEKAQCHAVYMSEFQEKLVSISFPRKFKKNYEHRCAVKIIVIVNSYIYIYSKAWSVILLSKKIFQK